MTHAEIPVTLGRTALQPLDSFTCPAVVVEMSPLNSTGTGDRALRPWIPGPDRGRIGRGRRTMAARLEAATMISRGQRILFWTLLVSSVLMAVVLLRMRERAMDRLLASAENHAAQSSGRQTRAECNHDDGQ